MIRRLPFLEIYLQDALITAVTEFSRDMFRGGISRKIFSVPHIPPTEFMWLLFLCDWEEEYSNEYGVHLTDLVTSRRKQDTRSDRPSFNFLDFLEVVNDREKRRRCVDRKSRRECRNYELFFYSCKHRMMKKYCRATCRRCKMLLIEKYNCFFFLDSFRKGKFLITPVLITLCLRWFSSQTRHVPSIIIGNTTTKSITNKHQPWKVKMKLLKEYALHY